MPSPPTELTIDVVSDVVCPWCFIGKRRLEKAIALKPEIAVTVRYRPFFLNPWVPREGISREQYLITKFGSVAAYMANAPRVAAAARAEGLVYNIDAIKRQPNTIDCHRLIRWAGESGDPARMKQRLMDLYFTEGADLSDREVLAAAASACGMDPAKVRQRLVSDEDVGIVTAEAQSFATAGVNSVPYFIFDGIFAVAGALEPDYLADAMERAVAERSKREAAEMARA
ncbi:MAG: DsbA family oxidoreductase [Alphaproteobacteria bacterium]|nr:DsbA family oxidoreductase [Alphaproteobacteria bacterium]